MGINGIGANYYQAGYTNNNATKAETGNTFAEIASQKVAEADKQYCLDRASKAFDTIGVYAYHREERKDNATFNILC